ncbi:hypothetical protein AXG93_4831s1140 [Marchantia polymorpha subsp. ruderalis]|uniref:C2HC zinc finger plants domain-containing protein n=1 Tax=Marchantia polymorpha subsp. ruderalis TaxID=1480154 RepID=A0A176WAE7_MARPO|nr:hypothetical protein AXG93_4831s1140 [Marchantia polymorpha subsp. ruderalis]
MEPIPISITDNSRHEISMDGIASLLAMARQRINEGNPSLALQAVVIALRASGGERAVLQAFSSAREIYRTERVAIDPVDELSALFADCGITDIHSINFSSNGGPHTATPVPSMQDLDMMEGNTSRIPISAPILAESGRLQVVMDASADGSSFVCLQCGGVCLLPGPSDMRPVVNPNFEFIRGCGVQMPALSNRIVLRLSYTYRAVNRRVTEHETQRPHTLRRRALACYFQQRHAGLRADSEAANFGIAAAAAAQDLGLC